MKKLSAAVWFVLALMLINTLITADGWAQNVGFYFLDYFSIQQNARYEALGKCSAVLSGDMTTVQLNPAGLAFNRGAALNYARIEPSYIYSNYLKLKFLGFSGAVTKNFFVGLSRKKFYWKYYNDDYRRYESRSASLYTITTAFSLKYGIKVGVNENYGVCKYTNEYIDFNFPPGRQVTIKFDYDSKLFFTDIGILKTFDFSVKSFPSTASVNLSIINVSNGKHEEKVNTVIQYKERVPQVASIGASYGIETNRTLGTTGLQLLRCHFFADVRDVYNSDTGEGYSLGVESTFAEMLSLRMGYYKKNVLNKEDKYYKKDLSDFTYGFGFYFPFVKLTNSSIPIDISFDCIKNENPSLLKQKSEIELPSFLVYTVTASWKRF